MVIRNTVFKYKIKRGLLHKVPAVIKILLLLPISFFCMSLPPLWLGAGILTAVILSFICGLSLHDQLTDFKPAFYYAVLMYALSVFSSYIDNFKLIPLNKLLFAMLIPRHEYLQITLRLILVVQASALLFRTTSQLEIREVVRSEIISLFLCFIPEIFKIWTSINMAWKARGGKENFAKIKTVVFVLISLCFEKAAGKAKALEARS
jgi:biotin transport system permease protein/energy-coupling factor transport system permease protein